MQYNIKEAFRKLEKAGIEPMGLNIDVTYSQSLHDYFMGEDDTMKYVEVTMTIQNLILGDDEERVEEYGVINGKLFTTFDEVTGDELNFLDVIDSIDQDTYEALSVFLKRNSSSFNPKLAFLKILYLDTIMIHEKYRGIGIGSILIEYIKLKFADTLTAVVVQPIAIEQIDESLEVFEQESKRIALFFKKHGFKKYKEQTWVYHES